MQNNEEENLQQYLTEDSIRQVALRFLKTYYKFRPRKGETTAGYNLTTKAGLVVDGYLSFKHKDDTPFLATLESTSKQKKGEINFTLQTRILFWDALAVGSLAGAFLYAYGYKYNHFTVNQIGLWGSVGVVLLTILAVFLLFRLVSKGFSRYRYIYAVEQFKRYQADEQWIAMGEDVFTNPNDRRLLELKNQCVYNGFGLMMVDKDFEAHLMITPARVSMIKGRKNIFQGLYDNRLRNAMRKTPLEKVWKKVKSVFNNLFAKFKNKSKFDPTNLMRFKASFWRQGAVVLVSFGLLAFILERELEGADIIHVDNNIYLEEMAELTSNTKAESKDFYMDSIDMKEMADISESMNGEKWRIEEDKSGTIDFQEKGIPKTVAVKTEEIAVYYNDKFIYYSCDRFFGFSGQKYVVTDNIFSSLPAAEHRIKQLSKINIPAHAFWVGCFDKAQGYVVYYDQIYNEKSTAVRASDAFFKQFRDKRKEVGQMKIMILDR